MILDFERPVKDIESRLAELRRQANGTNGYLKTELHRLEESLEAAKRRIYSGLTPYQKVQIARHPERPGFRHYREVLAETFYELSGDRTFGDDPAIRGGVAKLRAGGHRVILLGHDKGNDLESRKKTNFGMAHPEGYRKVKRLYELAGRFSLPIVALVDTPGAFAGRGAEERGQAWAISADLMTLAQTPVPIVAVIVGEGGSGGALAMCAADHVTILENSYLSVISPEACASIIFRDSSRAEDAARALKLTAGALKEHEIVDEILPEPLGGAHNDPGKIVDAVAEALDLTISELCGRQVEELLQRRYQRYRNIGTFAETGKQLVYAD